MKNHLVLSIILALFTVLPVFGQPQTESATVYFSVGQSQFDPALSDNGATIDAFISRIQQVGNTIDTITVRAYASPEGLFKANIQLAEGRCDAIIDYLVEHGISRELIRREPGGIAWDELRRAVEDCPDMPYHARVIDILENTPEWIYNSKGRIVDSRKKQLMDLAGGRPFRWMINNLFPGLRKAVAITAYFSEPAEAPEISEPSESSENSEIEINEFEEVVEPAEITLPAEPRHRLALKTNLLYYAALMPNLELEWLINDHWSVLLEGNVAPWSNQSANKCYQLYHFGPEARYWINPKAPWHGMFAGVFASGGLYDLQNGGNGAQGEGVMAGLSFGYMWPIARNWSMEASVGAGYMHTRYKEYTPRDGHYLYLRTKELNYFGPLKLKLSIAWRFWDTNKRKPNLSAI